MSAEQDVDKIVKRLKQLPHQSKNGDGRGHTATEIAKALRVHTEKRSEAIVFNYALIRFREEVPSACFATARWDAKLNRQKKSYRYDLPAVRTWLAGRTIRAVGTERRDAVTPAKAKRRSVRLQKDILFLILVLTRGKFTPSLFSRFLAKPPSGFLKPCPGVLGTDVHRWAQEVGIGKRRLDAAKKELPFASVSREYHGPRHWRLTEPVVIPAANPPRIVETNGRANGTPAIEPVHQDATTGGPPNKYPGHAKKPYRTGRKADDGTAEVYEWCYDRYVLDLWTAARVFEKAKDEFRGDAPSNVKYVAIYAERWAERFTPRLPDRDGPGVTELRSAVVRQVKKD